MIKYIIKFFDSNFFQTLVILIVGLFAFISYKISKNDEKRKAATIILIEARDIEKEIDAIKDIQDFFDSSPILTSNYWDKYKYLFTDILDEDEFKLINDFYNTACRIEEQRNIAREQICTTFIEKAKVQQWKVAEKINDYIGNLQDFRNYVNEIECMIGQHTGGFEGDRPKILAKKLAHQSIRITTSTAGNKLKAIINRKNFKK